MIDDLNAGSVYANGYVTWERRCVECLQASCGPTTAPRLDDGANTHPSHGGRVQKSFFLVRCSSRVDGTMVCCAT